MVTRRVLERELSRARKETEERVRAELHELARQEADKAYVDGVMDALTNVERAAMRYQVAIPRHILLGLVRSWKGRGHDDFGRRRRR